MKKFLSTGMAALLIGGMIFTAAPALAKQKPASEELNLPAISQDLEQDNNDDNNGSVKYKVRELDGWQELATLRLAARETTADIKTDMAVVRVMIESAKADQDKAALTALRTEVKDIKILREEFRQLRIEQRANWQDMRAARIAGDQELMQTILEDEIIPCREQKNVILQKIETALNEIL